MKNKIPEEIIPDSEIERVHANANFGAMDKREVVNHHCYGGGILSALAEIVGVELESV